MKTSSQRNSKGFTLIETLIYIAIIGIVVSSFISFSISISDSRGKTYVVQEVQANTRVALDMIRRRIRAAQDVNIANSIFDTDPGFLSLAMASSTLNPTTISLDEDNGTLVIKEGSYATSSITSDRVKVVNLVFTDLTYFTSRENIRIEISVEYNNISTSSVYSYAQNVQTAISLRQ